MNDRLPNNVLISSFGVHHTLMLSPDISESEASTQTLIATIFGNHYQLDSGANEEQFESMTPKTIFSPFFSF